MKHIAIIGATGSTGKELVRLASERNYKITLVVRNPAQVKPNDHVSVVKGDVNDLASLMKAFENVDIVISTFGPSQHRKVGTLMSTGTANIVKACEFNRVKRFVFMSGFVQADYNEMSITAKILTPLFRLIYHQSFHDKNIAEATIQNSQLNWTIVRAPGLNHSPPTGKYKAGIKMKIHFGMMSFADCARCLLDAVDEDHWTGEIINVSKN